MMIFRFADRFPGGRLLVFLLPILLFSVGAVTLGAALLIQVTNFIVLAIATATLVTWWRNIVIYFTVRDDAASMWLSLGTFTVIIVTVVNVSYSSWLRSHGSPMDLTSSWFVACTKASYAFGFGCLYLVPLAQDAIVPPKGWISLFAIVGLTAATTLCVLWFTP